MTSQISSPTVLISWAHRNTDWTPGQVKAWETTVKSFAERLRANRVNAQLDLYYQSDSSVDWTRWGQQMVRESDFVIIAASTAWKQRWEGTNAPTEGAGAVVEADALKGLFNTNQAEFQRKTLIVLLPGGSGDELPADLHRLNRFPVEEVTDTGIEDVLRTLYYLPRHAIPDLGPMPDLPPDTAGRAPIYDGDSASIQKCSPTASPTGDSSAPFVSAGSSVATRDVVNVVGNGNTVTVGSPNTYSASTTPYEIVARVEYLDRLHSASRSRREHRRLGAGLTPAQVSRSLSLLAHVPQDLKNLPAGEVRVLVGPLGSGKSDIAEEWIRSSITKAETDSDRTAPIPVWVSIGDLDGPLGNYIANEIGLPALSQLGVDFVVDGLDDHTDKAATALRQAAEFVAKWPNSRVVLTSRSQEKISSHLVVPAPSLSKAHAARMMARVAGHEIVSLGTHLETAVERPFFALLVPHQATFALLTMSRSR